MKWNPEEGKRRLGGVKSITDTPRPATSPRGIDPYSAYSHRAEEFITNTRDIDMSELYDRFLPLIPPGGHILDIGVGSGRDTAAFTERGYRVTAIEPDKELMLRALSTLGRYVIQTTIQEYNPENLRFDGVWASASLLHIHPHELRSVFHHIGHMLVPEGAFYFSFKYGEPEVRKRNGLEYLYLNALSLDQYVPTEMFREVDIWLTNDRRPGRTDERWLNVVLARRDT